MTIQQHASFDSSAAELNATSKLAKAWESKNAKNAAKAGGISMMALSLAACGGSDTATTAATTTTTTDPELLTSGTDTISASGTISAGMVWSPGGNTRVESLQSSDSVTGTGSADVLNVVSDGGTISPTLTGVETVNVDNSGSVAVIFNVSKATGIDAVNVTSSQGDVDIRSIQSADLALTVRDISDNATNVAFNYSTDAVTGSSTAVGLTIDGFDGAQVLLGSSAASNGTVAGAGVETLNLASSGSASVIANLASSGITALNVDADAQLTISALSATGVKSVDLTGSTATTSINVAANVDANVFSYTGGAGKDTLIMNTGFGATDSFDGGAGDADTLSIVDAAAGGGTTTVGALNSASASVVSNFETLNMTSADADFAVDMDTVAGVTAVTMTAAEAAADTLFTLTDLDATQAANLTLTVSGGVATTDASVDVDIKTNTTSDAAVLNATVTADSQQVHLTDTAANEFESATVNLSGAFDTVLDVEATSFLTSLTVTGGAASKDLTTSIAYANTTVDMSEVASNITFTTGGSAQTVKTGSGDDVITSNAGDKTVDLGAGDDSFSSTSAALTVADTIEGGLGTDTLILTTPAAIAATVGAKITGFERLSITDASLVANDIVLSNLGSTIERVTIGDTNNAIQTISGVQASFTDLRISDAAEADTKVTLTRTADTTSNAINLNIDGGETAAIVINDEETVSLTGSGTGTATVKLTSADMTSLTLTGANAIDAASTAIASATKLATVNAEAATGAVSVDAGVSTVDMTVTSNALGGVLTFTGGSGDDTITGTDAADNLTGGSGNDTINGGAGNEAAMNGGAGNDTLNGGAGNDVMDGGTGNDTVNGGAGNDTITYTDGVDTITTGAGTDTIHVTTAANSAFATDRVIVTDFDAGTSSTQVDDIELDLSEMNALDGIFATAVVNLSLGNATNLASGDLVFQTITADATAAGATTEMLLMDIGTYETDADFMTALAAGSLTVTVTAMTDNDGILMAYKTGSGDVNIGVGQFNGGATDTDAIDGFITLVTLQDFNDFSLLSAGDITIV